VVKKRENISLGELVPNPLKYGYLVKSGKIKDIG